MRLKLETQGALCVLNAKSQTEKSMKINVIYTVQWTRFIYFSSAYRVSASNEIREKTDFRHPNPSGATVKAPRTTLEIPPGDMLFSWASNTTLGKPLRYHI